jgi:hypothetical protein
MVESAAPAGLTAAQHLPHLLVTASLVGLVLSTSSTVLVVLQAAMQVQASRGLACSLVALVLVRLEAARQQWCWQRAHTRCCCHQMGQKVGRLVSTIRVCQLRLENCTVDASNGWGSTRMFCLMCSPVSA